MDILQTQDLSSFIFFFLPGFISLKVYHLIIPSEEIDFSKLSLEVISYSVINFSLLYTVLFFLNTIFPNFQQNHESWYLLVIIIFLFVLPIIWPILTIKITSQKLISSYIQDPILKAWDVKFKEKKPAWMIVHLKDGRRIGGYYGSHSAASSYPGEEQIYMEEVWALDQNGAFTHRINRSEGIIIMKDEISLVEFFKQEA